MEQQNLYKFILVIIMPLLILTLISISLEYIIVGIIFGLLMIDGIFGLLRTNRHLTLKDTFSSSNLRIIKNNICSICLFGIFFFKPSTNHQYVSLTEKDHKYLHRVQGFETGYFLMGTICLIELLYWSVKSIFYLIRHNKKIIYHNCFEQEAIASSSFNYYYNRRYSYAWLDFLFSNNKYVSLRNYE